jgi:hypothetical protein
MREFFKLFPGFSNFSSENSINRAFSCTRRSRTEQRRAQNRAQISGLYRLHATLLLIFFCSLAFALFGATKGEAQTLSALSCKQTAMTGSGTDSCTVTLTSEALSGGFTVSLSSNNTAVTVPATVKVTKDKTSANFTATVSSVATAQAVTLTASEGSVSETFALELAATHFVQAVASTTSGSANSSSLAFPTNTVAGDLILVGFDFNASTTPKSVTDSQGNIFTPVGTQLTSPSGSQNVVYYAKNIKGGADTVTVTISANANIIELYLTEYSGIDQTNPIDAQSGASGSAGPVSSGNATTNFASDVIYGYCPGDGVCTAGTGFATRSSFDSNLIEDETAGNPGSYAATGSASSGWTMKMVALKPASSGSVGPAPAITSATAASGTAGSSFSYQITATNAPASYGATGLPAGLTVNSGTGLISGTPTAVGTSTVTLSATNSGGAGSATLTLTVNATTPAITWAAPAAITYGTALNATQLDATSTVAGTFAYTPAAGTVLKAGSQTLSVTFTPTNTSEYSTATATVTLTVNQATPAITWAAPAAITYGTALSSTQLGASSTVAGTFAYTPAAGTVPKAGAQALSVTFTPTDAADYKAATATVTLTVNQATSAITWAAPAALTYGTALSTTQLDASSAVAGTFAYTPAAGTVLKAGSQTLSVTFTPTDITDYSTATTTVPLTVNQATPAITWAAPAAITSGTALSGTQLDASSAVPGTFVYSPSAGTILAVGLQTLSVTFTPTDATDYKATTATVTLTVKASTTTPTITWAAPAAIAYGTALSATQLDASSSVAGTFAYTPAAGTVLKAGSQTLSVTFTPTDTVDYSTATATVSLTVNQVTPALSWATPVAITYGTALSTTQLDASSTVAGTFVYTPAAGTVPKAGAQTLSVTFTPTDTTDYKAATATVTLTVNQATSAITWAAPVAVTYGTALSSTQLDASSTVAGTFTYTPAAGTMLKAGAQTLSVTFTPTDTTDCKGATASVTLTVNQATPAITWAAPAAITSGTALSSTQLDASSAIPGTFVYSPASGTVLAAGSQTLSVTFTPTDTTDYTTATQTVTLTISLGTSTLSINAASVGFGDVDLNTPTTQTVLLSSTGTGSVTVNSAVVAGSGFTLSGPAFPATLTTGQTATLEVVFDPTVTGAATGTLTVTSTSTSNPTAVIALTGTGIAAAYAVDLSWDAPSSSTDPVVGYNVYRAVSGSSTYALLNPSVDALTTYVDNNVLVGTSYDYIVESVDASGVESVPTSPIVVPIP